ncbi:variant leucine-rich repeat-containing protein [Microbacterium album]|uniref:Leucine rich repeat variant domain-containing protein n=1 Tax=Microbacterium album TaxID=2053191 RepID=A0A917MNM6_9MICO|nr:hypothetical protein [Microbacterium album]GGH42208.1 hypothetical protein GCM10010921_15280 [Microbacterium album]
MYWSFFDTLVLLTGIISAAIAAIPISTIPARTRMIAVLVGGGLVVAALVIGNMPSFRYPSVVLAGPVLALLAAGAIVRTALNEQKRQALQGGPAHTQYDESFHGAAGPAAAAAGQGPAAAPWEHAQGAPAPAEPHSPVAAPDPRQAAWAEVHDPSTSASRLAEIAAAHPEFAAAIAAHPAAYPELRAWAHAITGEPQA